MNFQQLKLLQIIFYVTADIFPPLHPYWSDGRMSWSRWWWQWCRCFPWLRAKYCSESSVTSRLLAKNQEHRTQTQTVFAYRLMGTRKTFTEGVDWREEPGVTWENEIIPQALRHSPSYLTNWECSKMQSSPWGKSIFKVVALDLFHAYFQCCYGSGF